MQTGRTTSSGRWSRLTCLALLSSLAHDAAAGLAITVLDDEQQPVGDIAVYAIPTTAAAVPPQGRPAVMEQAETAFVPHLLIIQSGSEVEFPNNDIVSHHVYSFSQAKSFELQLYRGNHHLPLRFDIPGAVVLGCNIHDGMLGYILVVETPYFGLTDGNGSVQLHAPQGEYAIHVWTPRARPRALPKPVTVSVTAAASQELTLVLKGPLMPAHEDHRPGASLTWDPY